MKDAKDFKRRTLKFIGSTIACAKWLPFAVNKRKALRDKLGDKHFLTQRISLAGEGYILINEYQRTYSIHIKAGRGDYIFAGCQYVYPNGDPIYNLDKILLSTRRLSPPDPSLPDEVEDKPFILEEHPFFEEMDAVSIPFEWWTDYFPDYHTPDDLFKYRANRFDWYNGSYIVLGGAGTRYWRAGMVGYRNPETPSAAYEEKLADTALKEMIPGIFNTSGKQLGLGPVGSECISAAIWGTWVFAVTLRGVLKYWKIGSDSFQTIQLPLPTWINETIDYKQGISDCSSETYYRAWGRGEDGIQWNFNPKGDALIGNINYLRVQRVVGGPPCDANELNHYCLPWVIYLQPTESLDGLDVSFDTSTHTADQAGSLTAIAADWLWTPDALEDETVLFYLKREEDHDTSSTLSPISSPYTAPHQGDLFQNDFLVMQRSGPSDDIRLFATLRRTEFQNMVHPVSSDPINLIENTVGDAFIYQCMILSDIDYDLRYQAYIYGAIYHKYSQGEIEAIEGTGYFNDNINKTSYNYVEMSANLESQLTPVTYNDEHYLSNTYAQAAKTYYEDVLRSYETNATSLYYYTQFGAFGMNNYGGAGISCHIIDTGAGTYSYRLASMINYSLFDDVNQTLGLDIIDEDGITTTHLDAATTFKYTLVPMTENGYDLHMAKLPTFCSFNYHLGPRYSPKY